MKKLLLLAALFTAVIPSSARAQVISGVVSGISGGSDSGQNITPAGIADTGTVIIISSTTQPANPILSVDDNNGIPILQVFESSGIVTGGATIPNGGASLVIKSTSSVVGTPIIVVQDSGGNSLVSIWPDGGVQQYSRTIAQLQVLAPQRAGEEFFCSNCTGALGATGKTVVSTGTAAGNFADSSGGVFK